MEKKLAIEDFDSSQISFMCLCVYECKGKWSV